MLIFYFILQLEQSLAEIEKRDKERLQQNQQVKKK